MYPLVNMYIFPFYTGTYIIPNKTIDQLCKKYSKKQIIDLFHNDKIDLNIKQNFEYSITQLIKLENNEYVIKISDYILDNYKYTDLFIDRVFLEADVIKFLIEKITDIINLPNFTANVSLEAIKKNYIYKCHYENKNTYQYMVDELKFKLWTYNWLEREIIQRSNKILRIQKKLISQILLQKYNWI